LQKNTEKVLNTMQKNSLESCLPLPWYRQKTEMISFSYDVMTMFTKRQYSYNFVQI